MFKKRKDSVRIHTVNSRESKWIYSDIDAKCPVQYDTLKSTFRKVVKIPPNIISLRDQNSGLVFTAWLK
jgi:hypothetical protein